METASHNLISNILEALNNKLIVGGIFCDLTKANPIPPLPPLFCTTYYTLFILSIQSVPYRLHNIPQLYGNHGAFPQRNHNTNITAHDHTRDTTRIQKI
jgi:hypothetical protein